MYRTIKEVFPQVYLFPANETQNVVMIATKSNEHFDAARVQQEGAALMRSGIVSLPTFSERLTNFWDNVPPMATNSPVLTDDYAPIESLLQGRR